MTPDEKFNRNIWRMLKQVKNAQLLTSTRGKITLIPPDHKIKLILFDDNYDLTIDTQKKLLNKLEEWKVLNLVPDLTGDISFSLNNITRFTISLNQPKFDQIYNQYKYKYEESNDNNNEISKKKVRSFKLFSDTFTKRQNNIIKKITIIKPQKTDGKYRFAINDNYKEVKYILKNSNSWRTLIKLIKDEESVEFNSKTKEIFDYFNYNKKCAVYFNGKYELSKIIEKVGNCAGINSTIQKEIITERSYKKRLHKSST